MISYLEHANLTVPDIDKAITFLQVVDPTFVVRHDSQFSSLDDKKPFRWAHIGNNQFYIALQETEPTSGSVKTPPQQPHRSYLNYGINHLAWVVDDFDAVIGRLDEHGYEQGLLVPPHPARKRAYYFDSAGFEWEIIQYLSDNLHERNQYEPE